MAQRKRDSNQDFDSITLGDFKTNPLAADSALNEDVHGMAFGTRLHESTRVRTSNDPSEVRASEGHNARDISERHLGGLSPDTASAGVVRDAKEYTPG